MDEEVAAALLCESFLPFPRPLAGPLKRGPVAGPGSAAGRVVALLREGGREGGRDGGREGGRDFSIFHLLYSQPFFPRATSADARGASSFLEMSLSTGGKNTNIKLLLMAAAFRHYCMKLHLNQQASTEGLHTLSQIFKSPSPS